MKSFVSSLSLVLLSSLVFGCGGGGDGPGADAGDEDSGDEDAAVDDAAMGPAPTLSYPSHAYTFLAPGTDITPIVPTATASGAMTFTVEGELPVALESDTGTLSGYVAAGFDVEDGDTVDVVITLTDEFDRKVEWPITFTLQTTGETTHQIAIDTSCAAHCAVPSPTLLANVHVGDFVVFSTQPGGAATIGVDGSLPLALTAIHSSTSFGINAGAGTTIEYQTRSGEATWWGSIQIVE